MSLFWTSVAWGHGNISKLPSSVQVLQYKMKLYTDKDDLASRNGLAMALYRTGNLDEALQELDTVLKADPQNFDAADGMGIVLIKKEKFKEALEYLQKALTLREKDIMVHVHLAVVYDKLNLADKSKAELEIAGSLVSDASEIEAIDKELKIVSGY
jgi:predicted Zn-dependent protease